MPSSTAMALPATPPRCRLLELPPELRLNIYDRVFDDQFYTIFVGTKCRVEHERVLEKRTAPGLELLLACRKIHREALPVFYDKCILHIVCYDPTIGEWQQESFGHPVSRDSVATALKHAKKVKMSVERDFDGTPTGLVSSINWVLEGLDFCSSLRQFGVIFKFVDGDADEELKLLKAFQSVKCSGTVVMLLNIYEQGIFSDEEIKMIRDEYNELVMLLQANDVSNPAAST